MKDYYVRYHLLKREKMGITKTPTHGGDSLPGLEELLNLPRDSAIRNSNFKENFIIGLGNKQEWNVESMYTLGRNAIR